MDLHLYIDTQARKLVSGPRDSSDFTFPKLFQGDGVDLFLHGLKPNTDPDSLDLYVSDPIAFSQIKCGIGLGPDAVATAGSFKVRVKGQVEATAALAYNIAPDAFLAAVNALASVQNLDAQGIKLATPNGIATNYFIIRWSNPAITAEFEVIENQLEPFCFVRSIVFSVPGGQIQILKLIVAPLAFTDQFSYPSAPPITPASVRTGTGTRNCVQSLTVPTNAKGTASFGFATNATAIVDVAEIAGALTDGSTVIQSVLNGIYDDGQTRFSVSKKDLALYYVEFVGPLAKQDFPLLVVEMHNQAPKDTPTGRLDLTTTGLELAIYGRKDISLIFELEITGAGEVLTPTQEQITIVNDMIDSGMALVANPQWLQNTDPSYPPYNPAGATIVGYRSYVTPLGGGVGIGTAGTSFVVTHNLGTKNCHVTVRETGGNNRRLVDNDYIVTYLNDDQIRCDFLAAPTEGQYEIIVSSAIAQGLAIPPHTHPISDIEGLQAILDALLGGQNPLDLWPNIPNSKLPTHIEWKNADGTSRFDDLPDDLLPDDAARLDGNGKLLLSEMPDGVPYYDPSTGTVIVNLPGPPLRTVVLLDPSGHLPVDVLPIDPSKWTGLVTAILAALQNGAVLPNAVMFEIADYAESFPPAFALKNHCAEDTTDRVVLSAIIPALLNSQPGVGALSGGLPAPAAAGCAGKRFAVAGRANSSVTLFRETQNFADGDVIASNGYQWFRADVRGAVAYPAEYNRELFSIYVSPEMLTKGSRFQVDFTLQAMLRSADLVRGQYLLTLEIGAVQAATGANVGPNLLGVNWYGQIIQEVIVLTGANAYHHFTYSVASDKITGALTATKALYTESGLAAPAPVSNGFAVRATLSEFDVENSVPNPSGQIVLKMVKPAASIVKL